MPVEKIIESVHPETPESTSQVEKLKGAEQKIEKISSHPAEKLREIIKPITKTYSKSTHSLVANSWQKKRAVAIDNILAEGLNDIFLKMNTKEQKAFKLKGEETVMKINELLSHAKVKVNKIIALIRDWLKLIPGINKFFLEQETKIKADKIIKIKDKF